LIATATVLIVCSISCQYCSIHAYSVTSGHMDDDDD